MAAIKPRVYVGKLADQHFAQAILRDWDLDIVSSTTSGAVARARASLEEHREQPVVLLLSTRTDNPIKLEEEYRGPIRRMLTPSAACREDWHLALAVPELEDWVLSDPRIRQDLESRFQGKYSTELDRALRVLELTKRQPFDATELLRSNDEYQALIVFLRRHSEASAKEAEHSSRV
jgi:hypothetical protein